MQPLFIWFSVKSGCVPGLFTYQLRFTFGSIQVHLWL